MNTWTWKMDPFWSAHMGVLTTTTMVMIDGDSDDDEMHANLYVYYHWHQSISSGFRDFPIMKSLIFQYREIWPYMVNSWYQKIIFLISRFLMLDNVEKFSPWEIRFFCIRNYFGISFSTSENNFGILDSWKWFWNILCWISKIMEPTS